MGNNLNKINGGNKTKAKVGIKAVKRDNKGVGDKTNKGNKGNRVQGDGVLLKLIHRMEDGELNQISSKVGEDSNHNKLVSKDGELNLATKALTNNHKLAGGANNLSKAAKVDGVYKVEVDGNDRTLFNC